MYIDNLRFRIQKKRIVVKAITNNAGPTIQNQGTECSPLSENLDKEEWVSIYVYKDWN